MRGLLDRLVYWLEEMTARYLRLETVVWREEGVRGPRNRRQPSENSGGGNSDFFFVNQLGATYETITDIRQLGLSG